MGGEQAAPRTASSAAGMDGGEAASGQLAALRDGIKGSSLGWTGRGEGVVATVAPVVGRNPGKKVHATSDPVSLLGRVLVVAAGLVVASGLVFRVVACERDISPGPEAHGQGVDFLDRRPVVPWNSP